MPYEHDLENEHLPLSEQDMERLRRLAQAIDAVEEQDTQLCRHVQQMLPRIAEAELRGERISRLYQTEVLHMDSCEECSLAYAELLDALLDLEEIADKGEAGFTPVLPKRVLLVMRLRGWVLRVSGEMVATLSLADPETFETAAHTLLERLPDLPGMLTPRQSRQLAMGWGADTDAAQVMIACWNTTEHIVGKYTSQQLDDLAASGALPGVARDMADNTARQLKLGKLRGRFVEMYVADVRADPHSLAKLARLGN